MAEHPHAIIVGENHGSSADMIVMAASAGVETGLQIDEERCRALGKAVANLPRSTRLDEEVCPTSSLSDEVFLRALLWATAICHSTKGAFRGEIDGREIKGWDYLLRAMLDAAEADPSSVSPESMLHVGPAALEAVLARQRFGGMVKLSDSARRAQILRELAQWLLHNFDGTALEIVRRANYRLADEKGLYVESRRAPGFQDPYQKKTSVLVGTAHYSRRFAFLDMESVVPMTDYHVMRVLCRTGCVVVSDPSLLQRLKLQLPVDSDEEASLREAAIEACRLAAGGGPVPTVELNMLLWAHARSLCRHRPVCVSIQPEHDSFRIMTGADDRACPFSTWCRGRVDEGLRTIWEPQIPTEYY